MSDSKDEYTISYAYPTSPAALAIGRGKTGAYILAYESKMTGYVSLADALKAAWETGAKPSYWSLDGKWPDLMQAKTTTS